jgi:hypothetical protein
MAFAVYAIASVMVLGIPGRAYSAVSTAPDGTVVMYSATTGEWYAGDPIIDRSSDTSPRIQTRLNPLVIGLCNAGVADLVVATMNSSADGAVDLKCGTSAEGYVHIRARHQTAWENQKGSGGLWDDFMVWATTNALAAPSLVINLAGSKRCYTTPLVVFKYVNGAPQYVKTFNPTIIVSSNNKKVITSIPTNTPSCQG